MTARSWSFHFKASRRHACLMQASRVLPLYVHTSGTGFDVVLKSDWPAALDQQWLLGSNCGCDLLFLLSLCLLLSQTPSPLTHTCAWAFSTVHKPAFGTNYGHILLAWVFCCSALILAAHDETIHTWRRLWFMCMWSEALNSNWMQEGLFESTLLLCLALYRHMKADVSNCQSGFDAVIWW